jgi:hypothetical protein
VRFIQLEPTKTGPIGTDGVGKDKGIAPVILGSRDTVTITEPVQLLGINRKDMEASFEQSFDDRATRHFDGHGYPLRLSRRQGPQPSRQLGQTGSIMVHGPCPYPATVAVEHTDLMLLRAPINSYKPLVRHGLIISFCMHNGRHDKTQCSVSSLSRGALSGDLP